MAYTFKNGDRPLQGYTIQRGVGRGGFGEVYYAVSDGGKEVGLKYLRDNPDVELRGVSHCMNLKSPHLVTIFDVMKSRDDEYFVVMEYIGGPSLRDVLIAEPKGLGIQKATFFLREIAKGLSYLHDRGIVHRDMKPGNIFYDDGYVKIGDYGLTKFISVSRHSAQTSSVGTVHYMAPEVGSGDYSRSIDIYALGVILYEMLLGRVPYEGSSMGEVLMKHLTSRPEVDNLPAPFADVIPKALAKDPKDRYQSVDEMIADVIESGDVADTLAGFNPDISLAGAVKQHAAKLADSPVPSPNPPPSPPTRPPPPPAVPFAGVGPAVPAQVGFSGVIGRQFEGLTGAALASAVASTTAAAAASAEHARTIRRAVAPTELSYEAISGQIRYAGFWIRFVAAFIDTIIVGTALGILGGPATGGAMIVYQGLMVGLWNGQTLGKRVCGIKVICADGRVCSVGRAFGRAFAKLLNIFTLGIGYLMAAFDGRKRALHDHVAGTLHIYSAR